MGEGPHDLGNVGPGELCLNRIAFADQSEPDPYGHHWPDKVDGAVVYEVRTSESTVSHILCQYFREGSRGEIGPKKIWNWDGDRETPTLKPSYGWGDKDDGWLVHLYFRDGQIQPLSDMILQVVNPTSVNGLDE